MDSKLQTLRQFDKLMSKLYPGEWVPIGNPNRKCWGVFNPFARIAEFEENGAIKTRVEQFHRDRRLKKGREGLAKRAQRSATNNGKRVAGKLNEFLRAKDLKPADVYHAANMSRQSFSNIRLGKGVRGPNKKTLLALSFGLRLKPHEAADLLEVGGCAFSKGDYRDQHVAFQLEKGCRSVMDYDFAVQRLKDRGWDDNVDEMFLGEVSE